MSILKNLFRKTTTKESGNDKPSKEFSPEMQLKIEQSRISYNLAVSTKEDLQERFGVNDLEIACSVAEEVTMTIEGVVKSEETRREIENYLLKAGVDKVFNNLKVENCPKGIKNKNLMNKENLNELLNSKTEDNATEIIIEIFDVVAALIENDDLKELSEPQKNFYFNQVFEMEVNNGGFSQYFFNISGEYAHETLVSLDAIGAKKTANLLQKAVKKFPNSTVPKDEEKRQTILEQLEDKNDEIWDKFDDKFYDYEDDLNELNLNYIRENIDRW